VLFFFFQAEDGIRDFHVTGVQTCALPIWAELTVLFGSLDVDARTAQPAPEGTVVDVGVLAGGIVLRVPETWQVVPEALVLLGGIDDKRPRPAGNTEDAPRVHIRGFVLMGGIEVQS